MPRTYWTSLFLVLFGCVTTSPIRYYTLNMTPSGTVSPVAGVAVERFEASEPLTRRNIMIKPTPIEVEYYANAQWAAAVADLVTEKLRTELGDIGQERVTCVVTGTVRAFEQEELPDGTRAHVKLSVVVRESTEKRTAKPLLEKTYEAAIKMPQPKPDDAADALSRALEEIARQIAADLTQLQKTHNP